MHNIKFAAELFRFTTDSFTNLLTMNSRSRFFNYKLLIGKLISLISMHPYERSLGISYEVLKSAFRSCIRRGFRLLQRSHLRTLKNFVSEKSGKRFEESGKHWIESRNREIFRRLIFFLYPRLCISCKLCVISPYRKIRKIILSSVF